MGIRKEFVSDTIIYGLGNGIKKFIGIFLLPFYTRALSPADYGILDSLSTFTLFFSAFLNLGLDSASGFYFFKVAGEEEKGKILFSHFIIRIIGIIPPLILSFFSSRISQALFSTTDYTWMVFISILLIPVNLLMGEQSQIYRFYHKPWQYNIITMVKSLVNIGLGVSLVVILKWGVLGAQIASVFSSLMVVIGSFIFFTRKVYKYEFSWFWIKKMVSFGFPLIWAGLAGWIYNSSDRFFLLHYSNLSEIGYYSIGNTFSQPILIINMAVQMSFGVIFFKIYYDEQNQDKPESKRMAIESFNIYLGVTVLIATFLSFFGIDLINIIATKDYGKGALAIPFLTFSFIAAQAFQSMGPGITLAEKNWHYTWITIVTALINFGLNFIFVPRWGFVGAAETTFISYVIYWILKVWVSHGYFKIDYPFAKIFGYFFISFFLSLIPVILDLSGEKPLGLIIKVICFLVFLFLTYHFNFIPKDSLKSSLRVLSDKISKNK